MRTVARLSPAKVSALVKAGAKGVTADGAGLYLQVTGAGRASWIFRYAERGTGAKGARPTTRYLGLGAVHTVGLADARDKARKLRQQLLEGIDPAQQRREAKEGGPGALTFQEVVELYIAAHEAAWRSPVHARQWRASMRDYAVPILGGMNVAAIDTGAVMKAIEPIWRTKTETASRVRQRVEATLDYARARGWRSGENPARWRGHLANLLPAKEKVAPVEHYPAMEWKAVPALMAELSTRQGFAAKALAILILTATRSAECRGATWGEIDIKDGVWTIPAARMKAAREHRIPLPAPAVAILRGLRPDKPGADELVFPGAKPDKPISDVALVKLLPPGVTLHGFRSSFRTWAGENTAYAREVIETALAHRIGDAVEQAYSRGDLFQRRRRLMEDWAAYATGTATAATGDVIPMRAKG